MPRDDAMPTTGADQLNAYLDELTTRGVADWQALDPSLAATADYIHGLDDRSASVPGLMEHTWRELMSTARIEQGLRMPMGLPIHADRLTPPIRLPKTGRWTWSRRLGEGLAAAVLLIALGAGYGAYRLALPGDDPRPTMPAAITQGDEGDPLSNPSLADCTVDPRPDGSAAALAGTPISIPRILPRLGYDPVHPNQAAGVEMPIDGTGLLFNTSPAPAEAIAEIETTLAELTACRFYVTRPPGVVDPDGRFFALYTDDFLRGEMVGYLEAGLEPSIHTMWASSTVATVFEARQLQDGRVLAILDAPAPPDSRWVGIFAQVGDRWLVDEVGLATFPSLTGTPAISTPAPVEPATPEVWTPTLPILQEIALFDFDQAVAGAPWVTIDSYGTPVPVTGDTTVCEKITDGAVRFCGYFYEEHGPYRHYKTLPADTDVTFRVHNTGARSHRFVVEELGVDVEVGPGESAEFVLNAPVGTYPFLIYEDDPTTPIDGGVFEVIPLDQGPPPLG